MKALGENEKRNYFDQLILNGFMLNFGIGGEGGIRTRVPDFSDHPISSRRRYGHFGTSPQRRS